jgi:Fe2+ transport system protein B
VDPITLFALANGAVAAVKQGCALYKEIKGAAGEVGDILKDLEQQFHSRWDGKPVPVEAKNQYIREKNRVIELNKRGGETTNIYQEIGNHLGTYYDNYYKCLAVFEEEERRAHTEVYQGEDSLGKRALQRVLMKKQLEQMRKELREIMVYQMPTELGALYTEVEDMMQEMGKEQKILVAQHMQREARDQRLREQRRRDLNHQAVIGAVLFAGIMLVFYMFAVIIQDRIERYPEYGNCVFPRHTWVYEKWTKTIWSECK